MKLGSRAEERGAAVGRTPAAAPTRVEGGRVEGGAAAHDDVVTAFHEAGHAAAAVALGGSLSGPCSIRKTLRWAGVCYSRPPAIGRALERVDVALPIAVWPAKVRRFYEIGGLVALAGPAAEHLVPADVERPAYRVDTTAAAEILSARLSARDAHLVAIGDDPEQHLPTDLERAFADAETLVGPGRGFPLVQVWNAEANDLIRSYPLRRRVEVLAGALLEHTTLSARDVRAVLKGA